MKKRQNRKRGSSRLQIQLDPVLLRNRTCFHSKTNSLYHLYLSITVLDKQIRALETFFIEIALISLHQRLFCCLLLNYVIVDDLHCQYEAEKTPNSNIAQN